MTATGFNYKAMLQRRTNHRELSEQAWRDGIREAHASGMSLRDIAEIVGVTHTRVWQIVRET